MYIEEVHIDGFKSYASHTTVPGFDPHFNAITGLNGSGKSNVLDSICFVLGISNLSQVRVSHLQELVYKQGQAGVTKATVTITFNNQDKKGSPVGYEQFDKINITRQIVIGGKNKYFINNHTVQASEVQNLFHSVQLNVNNPHFLIMQGRITKVLNMKPPEILSMIEEAAGTRMFENKKIAAIRTMEKKHLKMGEINRLLNEEITPTLDKLKEDKTTYMKWCTNRTVLDRLTKKKVAYSYYQGEQKIAALENELKETEDDHITNKDNIDHIKADLQLERGNLEKARMEREGGSLESDEEENFEGKSRSNVRKGKKGKTNEKEKKKSTYATMKAEEERLSKALVKANTLYKNKKNEAEKEEKQLGNLRIQFENLKKLKVEKENQILKTKSLVDEESHAFEIKKKVVDRLQEKIDFLNHGGDGASSVSSKNRKSQQNSPSANKLTELINQFEADKTECKQAELKLKHLKTSEKKALSELGKSSKSMKTLMDKKVSLEKEIESLEAKKRSLSFNQKDFNKLEEEILNLEKTLLPLQQKMDALSMSLESKLNFTYNLGKGFDTSKVKGLIAKLFKCVDAETYASALEVVAGGKLYQVVVDNEQTGKLLLQKGGLKKRVTLLPLNKISHSVLEQEKLARAESIARQVGGSANLALNCVEYSDSSLKPAIEYTFGQTLICSNSNAAKSIAFDKNIKRRTVTLDGDVYDPSGTLTGGSRSNIGTLLIKLHELNAMTNEYNCLIEKLNTLQTKLKEMQSAGCIFTETADQVDMKIHELGLISERIKSMDNFHRLQKEVDHFKDQIDENESIISTLKKKMVAMETEIKTAKLQEETEKANREETIKSLQKEMSVTKKELDLQKKRFASSTGKLKELEMEIQATEEEIGQLENERISSKESACTSLSKERDDLKEEYLATKEQYEKAKQTVTEEAARLKRYDATIAKLEKTIDSLESQLSKEEVEAKRINASLIKLKKTLKDMEEELKLLMSDNEWIAREKAYFGAANTDYDFSHISQKESPKAKRRNRKGKKAVKSRARNADEEADDMDVVEDAVGIENSDSYLVHLVTEIETLSKEQETLSKSLNKKVLSMVERAESEYEALVEKKRILETERNKIESVIEELDVKKNLAIQETWVKINVDLGQIFGTLLPGTNAKLEIPNNGRKEDVVKEGLEIRVAFGNVWKDSLTELSGGQRSLLALSLILALLRFKPAPMYILDEVDAALDLSHTQNIGAMLKKYFTNSQFIIVSLKEGMFNNANVIFRTKFVDGISTITRTLGNQAKEGRMVLGQGKTMKGSSSNQDAENDENDPRGRNKGKRVGSAPLKKKGKTSN